jgi:16S rRNA (cytosine967-C5)-methyltransferase
VALQGAARVDPDTLLATALPPCYQPTERTIPKAPPMSKERDERDARAKQARGARRLNVETIEVVRRRPTVSAGDPAPVDTPPRRTGAVDPDPLRPPRAAAHAPSVSARASDVVDSPAPASAIRATFRRPADKSLPPTARNLAATVIARVEKDEAFAAAVLDAELRRSVQFSARDRAFATELVYGTLRLRTVLERAIEAQTPRGIEALDPRVRAHLLVAAYQLLYSRVPAFAAVSEAVNAIRTARGRALAGFANGTLRAVARENEAHPAPALALAVRDSTAPWLRRALERSIGDEATEAYLTAGPIPPPNTLRLRGPLATMEHRRAEWIERLRALPEFNEASTVALGDASPAAIRVRGGGDLRALPGHEQGAWVIQDEGSQIVAWLVGARPGDRVLDACAGRGNKTIALLDLVGAKRHGDPIIEVHAADHHPDKLDRLDRELARLGLPSVPTHGVDWSIGVGEVPEGYFDRVLVDAPCSGIGTLRRRPEIQTRRQAADLPALSALQQQIVGHALRALKPGGRLIYAVCSVLRDEAEGVIRAILDANPGVEPTPFDAVSPSGVLLADSLFGVGEAQGRLLTHIHGTDGYFIASLRKAG